MIPETRLVGNMALLPLKTQFKGPARGDGEAPHKQLIFFYNASSVDDYSCMQLYTMLWHVQFLTQSLPYMAERVTTYRFLLNRVWLDIKEEFICIFMAEQRSTEDCNFRLFLTSRSGFCVWKNTDTACSQRSGCQCWLTAFLFLLSGIESDIIDEAIYYFKANVFFKNYEIKVTYMTFFYTVLG